MELLIGLLQTHGDPIAVLVLVALVVVVGFLAKSMRAHEVDCNAGRSEARAERARLMERVDAIGVRLDNHEDRIQFLERGSND